MRHFLTVCLLGLCGIAFGVDDMPTVVYVSSSGSGDLSGRDWENATNNLTGAYALCASNALGGTVYLAGGIYRSTQWSATLGNYTRNAAIVPASNVALIGSADPSSPTILTGDLGLDDKWSNGSSQWSGGKLVEPPETSYIRPSNANKGADVTDSCFFSTTSPAEGCRFENLTFHGFSSRGMSIANVTNLVIENCRFIGFGNNEAHDGNCCLFLSESPAEIINCTFTGHRVGLRAEAASATKLTVSGCTFRNAYCSGGSTGGGVAGVSLKKNVDATIADSEFAYLRSEYSPAVYTSWPYDPGPLTRSLVLSNCVIRSCDSSMMSVCNIQRGGTVDGCAFISNKVVSSSGGYYKAACIDGDGSFDVFNSYFGGNTLVKSAGSTTDAAVLATQSGRQYRFVNCTVEDNCVTGTTGSACAIGGWRPDNCLIANCVFRNNEYWNGTTRGREIKANCFECKSPTFVNTIFWHPADGYVPFRCPSGSETYEKRCGFAHCDIKNYEPPAMDAKNNGFAIKVVHEEPFYADRYKLVGSRAARRLAVKTNYAVLRQAAKLCRATDGEFYFLDTSATPNVWRKLSQTSDAGAKLSLADGEAIGLTPDMEAYPDVYGEARRKHSAFGPVDTRASGLVIVAH